MTTKEKLAHRDAVMKLLRDLLSPEEHATILGKTRANVPKVIDVMIDAKFDSTTDEGRRQAHALLVRQAFAMVMREFTEREMAFITAESIASTWFSDWLKAEDFIQNQVGSIEQVLKAILGPDTHVEVLKVPLHKDPPPGDNPSRNQRGETHLVRVEYAT